MQLTLHCTASTGKIGVGAFASVAARGTLTVTGAAQWIEKAHPIPFSGSPTNADRAVCA
jgi:hypothetical protein